MNKKFLALAAAGAAYYLFNTKKGNEVRQNLGQQVGSLVGKAKDQLNAYKQKASDLRTDNSLA